MGISGQTIWRQTGNFLRKQKIIRKITYYESGYRQQLRLLNTKHKVKEKIENRIEFQVRKVVNLLEMVRKGSCSDLVMW